MSYEDDDAEGTDGYDPDTCIIMDNGSGNCKAGLSCNETPTAVFAEIVGKPRSSRKDKLENKIYCGQQAFNNKGDLYITHPIENGIIENFEHMEYLWEHTMVELLEVNPTEHPVLLTEPPYNPKPNREKMVEIMFETFGVPSLNISIQGVLALLGQGRTTGLVLDSGEGVTHTIPIFEGFGMPHCINRLDLAGKDLNTLLAKLMALEGQCLCTTVEQEHVRKMKEDLCYVAMDANAEFADSATYTMPDGNVISLADERWKCPEALFNPSLVGLESVGVAGLVWESVSKCEIDLRKNLLTNVVLSGGSTMFKGFRDRLSKELRNYAPTAVQANIRVVPSKDQIFAVWSGAQVSASLRSMQEEQWMTCDDFDEYGASFIHDKIAVKYN